MAEKILCISQLQTKPIKVIKWKVREGNSVSIGRIILIYDFDKQEKSIPKRLKSSQAGTVHKIIAQEGAIVKPGEVLFELKACSHPTIMKDMCAECGADLRKDDISTTASVPMVHAIPELKVCHELAQKLGQADINRLTLDRKLVLLVDLDQTLIHTTNDNIPPNIKDVYHFQLYGPHSPWYHTRLRPGTHEFLKKIFPFFELHICTFGARNYAHTIAMFLDKDQSFFSNRILSRDECFDPTSKKANLTALFPCGDDLVCIIDDREDVWSHATNLIHVKPYHFFQHTGDINAPPGLDKHENDDKAGVDLTKIKKNGKQNNNDPPDEEPIITKETLNGNKNSTTSDVKINEQSENKASEIETVVNGDNLNSKEDGTKTDEIDVSSDVNKNNNSIVENIGSNCIEKKDETIVENKDAAASENDNDTSEKTDENAATSNNDTTDIDLKIDEIKIIETKTDAAVIQKDNNLIEIEDPDDYLIYLEEILKRIHAAFYEEYDILEAGKVPDLKKVIPAVRGKVLNGMNLVFSGLVPTHLRLEHSKAYQVARGLGAKVTQDLEDDTTHLVAVRPGTVKYNAAKRRKNLKIVMPDWLWSCAERWEHVNEKLFILSGKGSKNRHPPPHCSSPEHITSYPEHDSPALRKRTPSGRFMDTINPLMSFSSADIADMDKEVEDILDDDSESSDDEAKTKPGKVKEVQKKVEESSSSSDESLTGETRGHKRKRTEVVSELLLIEDLNNSTEEEEMPSTKFRRGEKIDSEFELDQDSQESTGSLDVPDEVDDGDWNMMGAALEREFLSNE